MMPHKLNLLVFCWVLFSPAIFSQKLPLPRWSLAGSASAHFFSGINAIYSEAANPFSGGLFGARSDWGLNHSGPFAVYASTGAQVFKYDYGTQLFVPLHLRFGLLGNKFGVLLQGGCYVHTGGTFLQPAILPSWGIAFDFMTKKDLLIEIEIKSFRSYAYKVFNGGYNGGPTPPFLREGWGWSPGLGLTIGHLERRSQPD